MVLFWLERGLLVGEKVLLILLFQQNTVLAITLNSLSVGYFPSICRLTGFLNVGGHESKCSVWEKYVQITSSRATHRYVRFSVLSCSSLPTVGSSVLK